MDTAVVFRRYDADEPSSSTYEDCVAAVGSHAVLHLTGTIVDARSSSKGSYVIFEVDKRWGFSTSEPYKLGLNLDALEYQGGRHTPC